MNRTEQQNETATAEFKNVVSDQVAEFQLIDPTTETPLHGCRPWIRVSDLPQKVSMNKVYDITYDPQTNQILSLTPSEAHNKTVTTPA